MLPRVPKIDVQETLGIRCVARWSESHRLVWRETPHGEIEGQNVLANDDGDTGSARARRHLKAQGLFLGRAPHNNRIGTARDTSGRARLEPLSEE